MTDRYSGFIVILDKDIRDDDAETTISAIKMIKGVIKVKPHHADQVAEMIAKSRLRSELLEKIVDFLSDDFTLTKKDK